MGLKTKIYLIIYRYVFIDECRKVVVGADVYYDD